MLNFKSVSNKYLSVNNESIVVGAQWKSRDLNLWIKMVNIFNSKNAILILPKEDIWSYYPNQGRMHDIFSRVLSFGVHRQ